jgi:hypothetical protein
MSSLLGKSWADLSDSDTDDESDVKVISTANSNLNNIKTTSNELENLIVDANNQDFQKNIFTFVTARIKNYSQIGLNKVEKNIKEFCNIKVEFYYPRRKLKINRLYKKISYESFKEKYDSLNGNMFSYKDFLQYCSIVDKIMYIPFFQVDNKYYDFIKYFSPYKLY